MRAGHQGCTADSHIVKAKCSGSFAKKAGEKGDKGEHHCSHELRLNEVA
jgi:hypothetical protein